MSSSGLRNLNGSCFCHHVQFIINLESDTSSIKSISNKKLIDSPSQFTPTNLTLSAYCHCTNCQRLNGSPFVWTTHWKHQALVWISPSMVPFNSKVEGGLPETVDVFESMPGRKFKLRCKSCGSPIGSYSTTLSRNPSNHYSDRHTNPIIGWDLIKPTVHQFYGTRIMDVKDQLTRWAGYEAQSERLD
ncbi:hypothetical protein CROQUDRAFT_668966 [Cronartium quercuum f. sp. fusiforme G11]|uniref:CENP-V/GFA domain-containing protein n=1 Tax=Cronartium quercuum f. sp. fusiforme G11 TaxID=708437 RepID=A0A9P6TGK2_9BASI|nr:hypothetical protein CROQUDRAFT_668966 [Cronartium quercuum f. sp. fusiforme G11]